MTLKAGDLVKGPVLLKRDAFIWATLKPLVVIAEPHAREDDASGILYVTVQAQNASGPPHDLPVADVEPYTP